MVLSPKALNLHCCGVTRFSPELVASLYYVSESFWALTNEANHGYTKPEICFFVNVSIRRHCGKKKLLQRTANRCNNCITKNLFGAYGCLHKQDQA